jgi:hypothetical protein
MGRVRVVTPRPVSESHSFAWGALSGNKDERILPGWLNAARETNSYKRVTRIISLIRESEESARKALAQGAYHHRFRKAQKSQKWPKEKLELQRAAQQPYTALQRTLQRYSFQVSLTGTIYGDWMLNLYCPTPRNEFRWNTEYGDQPQGAVTISRGTYGVSEGDAVLAVLRLTERGLFNRIRQCATCTRQWLYAKHRNYRFCSAKCREDYYVRSDDYRRRKAVQMRQHREQVRQAQERGVSHR